MKVFKRIHISLQTRLTLLVCTVVLVSLSVTGYLIGSKAAKMPEDYQAEKVMDIASTISHTQLVIDGINGRGPVEEIQSFTSAVQEDTSVEYIVVIKTESISVSPIPWRRELGNILLATTRTELSKGNATLLWHKGRSANQ